MSRSKKSRHNLMEVLKRPPRKQELLADPTSREARRKRNQDKQKRHTPVAERTQSTMPSDVRDRQAGRRGTRHGGRLAEKIRRLNEEKRAAETDSDNASDN